MSYRGPNVHMRPSGNSSSNFIFIAVAIIIVFVVLYYAYNFMFSTIGFPVPNEVFKNAINASMPPAIVTKVTPPYEGGDYTISFWLYVGPNSASLSTGTYRKHIVDIGGANFSTVAIGLDATANNLIVRTHTGASDTTGTTSNPITNLLSSLTGSNSASITGGTYVSDGGQTYWTSGVTAANSASKCFTYDLTTNKFMPKSPGTADTGCLPPTKTTGASGPACTSGGLIDRKDGVTNLGWDSSCNPCDGYWISPGSTAGTGAANLGWTGSDHTTATYVSYSSSKPNPCAASCVWANDGTFYNANNPSSGTGGTGGTGTSGTGGICSWNNSVPRYKSSVSTGSDGSDTSTNSNYDSSSTPSCAKTATLDSATMKSLFNTPVAAPCESQLPSCDVPGYDLQRWTLVTVVLSGKITDVYMNGKLARSCIGASYFKVDQTPTLNLLKYNKFDGKLANLNLYSVALNPAQIYELYTKGPTT